MKKNIFAIALAFALTLGGCANQTDSGKDDESDEKDDTAKTEQEKDSDEEETEAENEIEDSQEGKSETEEEPKAEEPEVTEQPETSEEPEAKEEPEVKEPEIIEEPEEKEPEVKEEPKAPQLSDYTDEELIEMAKLAVEALDSCKDEVYGAQCDSEKKYEVIIRNDVTSGVSEFIMLAPSDSIKFENTHLYIDGEVYPDDYTPIASATLITNFKTIEDVCNYNYQYMTESYFDNNFKDEIGGAPYSFDSIALHEGNLYLMRRGKSYGVDGYSSEGIEVLQREGNTVTMKIIATSMFSENPEYECKAEFVFSEDGRLRINNITL